MPHKRIGLMHDDGFHAPMATGSALMIYGWTLENIVLALWAIYVVILIAIKLPDMCLKYPIIGRFWRRLWGRK